MVKEKNQKKPKRKPPSTQARNGTSFAKVCSKKFSETSHGTLDNNDQNGHHKKIQVI